MEGKFLFGFIGFWGGGVLFCVVECVVSFVDWEMGI